MGNPIKITTKGIHYLLHVWQAEKARQELTGYDIERLLALGFIEIKDGKPEVTFEGMAQINRIYTK